MKTWLLVNAASGSNDEESARQLVRDLCRAGARPQRVIDVSDSGEVTLDHLAASRVDLLVTFTGDGTLSRVLPGLEGWSGKVLVLPGGTTNLLSKALHGEAAETETILASLADGSLMPVRRETIAWSGGRAVIELLAGPGATWSEVREELREGSLLGVAQTALEAVRQTSGGSLVRVTEPGIGAKAGYAGVRLVPEAGRIVVDGYGADSLGDYLRQGVALVRRNFREGPHDQLGGHPELICVTIDGAPMDLMVDGEGMAGRPVERFSLAPLGVDLLALRE